MAENPYKNKIVYDGDTLIDLTEDTVTPNTLLAGTTAHDRSGAPVTGTYTAPVTSVNGQTGDVVLDATDVGVDEVTVSTSGAVSQALAPGKIYHFTGAVSSLSLTLTAAASGQLAQYHFDFNSGSTPATVTITGVTWSDGSFVPEASKRYECDILNGYGVYLAW